MFYFFPDFKRSENVFMDPSKYGGFWFVPHGWSDGDISLGLCCLRSVCPKNLLLVGSIFVGLPDLPPKQLQGGRICPGHQDRALQSEIKSLQRMLELSPGSPLPTTIPSGSHEDTHPSGRGKEDSAPHPAPAPALLSQVFD